jgi:ABC-type phosphate/phosphonate transport system permease subunit
VSGAASSRPPAFLPNWPARLAWLALIAYVFYAASILDVTWERFVIGLDNGVKFIGRMLPPDTAPDKMSLMLKGLYETLEIAVISSALGILLSLPVGLLAARNLMPAWVTWPIRLLIALCRSFHQVIIAILFVKAVGFGALAGILALTVASIGFIAKLFAEAIEEISLKQVEAIRATGAPFMSVIAYGVMPQAQPLRGLRHLPGRLQPAQFHHGRHRRRRRHRRHHVCRLPAFRLRLPAHHTASHHRPHHGERDAAEPHQEALSVRSERRCARGEW